MKLIPYGALEHVILITLATTDFITAVCTLFDPVTLKITQLYIFLGKVLRESIKSSLYGRNAEASSDRRSHFHGLAPRQHSSEERRKQ